MVVFIGDVEGRRKDVVFQTFELAVALHSGYVKTSGLIKVDNCFQFHEEDALGSSCNGRDGAKFDPFRDGVKVWASVYPKNVDE